MVRNRNKMIQIGNEFCPDYNSKLYLTVLQEKRFCKNCYEYKDKWNEVL